MRGIVSVYCTGPCEYYWIASTLQSRRFGKPTLPLLTRPILLSLSSEIRKISITTGSPLLHVLFCTNYVTPQSCRAVYHDRHPVFAANVWLDNAPRVCYVAQTLHSPALPAYHGKDMTSSTSFIYSCGLGPARALAGFVCCWAGVGTVIQSHFT